MPFLDTLGPRQHIALDAIRDLLNDGRWHTHHELLTTGLNASDLTPKTVEELIRRAWRAGLYRRSTTTRIARARNALYRNTTPSTPTTRSTT